MTPSPAEPTRQDHDHLRILGIFHYVVAGLTSLMGLFPVLHLMVGLGLLFAPETMFSEGTSHTEFPFPIRLFGLFFAALPAIMIVAAQAFAVTIAVAGRRLRAHSHYTYCQVMAAVACVFMPFGTVLGIFTLLVLARPSVKTLFGIETPCQF
jgi:hypothetical protein